MDGFGKAEPLGKVLVIGGCGFLGSHIVEGLDACDASISILDFRSGQQVHTRPDIKYYDSDITSLDAILPVFEKGEFDVVIHTVSPLFLDGTDAEFQRVNVGGTKNIIEAAQRTGVKALVYTSTAIVVQNNFDMPIANADESWPIFSGADQEDDYARSKAQAEAIVLGANRKNLLLTCAIRPSGIFGERDSTVIPVMIETYEAGQHHFQVGDNTALRDWIYAGDLAHAHILAASALLLAHSSPEPIPENKRVDGEAFFVTGGDPVPFWDFARFVFKGLGDKSVGPKVQISMGVAIIFAKILQAICGFFGTKSALTVKNVYACCQEATFNNRKARERLGFRVALPLEAALERTTKWFMKNKEAQEQGETV